MLPSNPTGPFKVPCLLVLSLPQLWPLGLTLPCQVLPCLMEQIAPVGHEISQPKCAFGFVGVFGVFFWLVDWLIGWLVGVFCFFFYSGRQLFPSHHYLTVTGKISCKHLWQRRLQVHLSGLRDLRLLRKCHVAPGRAWAPAETLFWVLIKGNPQKDGGAESFDL